MELLIGLIILVGLGAVLYYSNTSKSSSPAPQTVAPVLVQAEAEAVGQGTEVQGNHRCSTSRQRVDARAIRQKESRARQLIYR